MTRSAAQPRTTPDGFEPGALVSRRAADDMVARLAPASYDAEARTVEAIFSTGARVRRWGIIETLAVSPEAIDLGRLAQGALRVLDTHDQESVKAILGVVTEARIENGQLVGRFRFADSDSGRTAEAMVRAGDLTGISVGYRVTAWGLVGVEDGVEVWRAERWELLEVSLVAVPADPAAMVRSGSAHSQQEIDDMRRNVPSAPGSAPVAPAAPAAGTPPAPAPDTRAAPAPAPAAVVPAAPAAPPAADADAAVRAENTRVLEIMTMGRTHGIEDAAVRTAIENRTSAEAFGRAVLDTLAARSEQTRISGQNARVNMDETETRRRAMTEALAFRLSPRRTDAPQPSDAARAYMEHSVVELAADAIGHRGRMGTAHAREDILRRAFHTTSDFPIIFEAAINTALGARYAAAQPTYRRISRQRTYMDFRDHNVVRPGDFPMLKPITETGEIPFGSTSEAKEKTRVLPYGIAIGFSRQMLVNDTLGAIDQILADHANRVVIFEEKTFYAMLLSASGAGPTLLETTRAVFNTTDGTLAAAASAVTTDAIALGRQAMRTMKDQSGEPIDVGPAIILTGPAKETETQKVLSPVQAAQASNVPIFSGVLSQITTARITGNSWYLFADPSVLPCFEWGLLEGYAAPRLRLDEPFGVQGLRVSLEHDFGCGAIDYRGAYRNAGA